MNWSTSQHAKRGSGRRRSAFTFVELILVVLIVGILASTAAPRYGAALSYHRAELAARKLAADLGYVRDYAQRSSTPQTITFDFTADTYVAPGTPDPSRPGSTLSVDMTRADAPADLTGYTGVVPVQFDIYGRPSLAGSVTVRSGAAQRVVALDLMGNVTLP